MRLNESATSGVGFGLVSGVITTLGLMSGLYSGTHSVKVVVGGVITIAIADALSDALGMHIAEESRDAATPARIWTSTLTTFLTKFCVALSFLIPLLTLELPAAMAVSLFWGLFIIAALSYRLARLQRAAAVRVIGEHVGLTVVVVVTTYFIGVWTTQVFG